MSKVCATNASPVFLHSVIEPAVALRDVEQRMHGTFHRKQTALYQFCGHRKVLAEFAEIRQLDQRVHVVRMLVYYRNYVVRIETLDGLKKFTLQKTKAGYRTFNFVTNKVIWHISHK